MNFYKYVADNYIICIGTGGMGVPIDEEEFNRIKSVIDSKPPSTESTDYRLKTDLTWEEYEIITETEEGNDE